MRRNFAQVLKAGKIDLKKEYTKFYHLFYRKDDRDHKSIAEIISENFIDFHFRGTCLTLEEFDEMHNYRFEEQPQDFNEEYLVCFMEYIYNLIIHVESRFFFYHYDRSFYLNQIQRVVEMIGYDMACQDGFTILVPKDNNVIAVAESELIPECLSYKVLEYNHHSMKGDVESKKETLIKLADALEAKRPKLSEINKSFSSDLFALINSCNIRHNNTDASSGKYHKYIAEMDEEEMENTYDEIYQMCLLAFMQLEHADRKEWIRKMKSNIFDAK